MSVSSTEEILKEEVREEKFVTMKDLNEMLGWHMADIKQMLDELRSKPAQTPA